MKQKFFFRFYFFFIKKKMLTPGYIPVIIEIIRSQVLILSFVIIIIIKIILLKLFSTSFIHYKLLFQKVFYICITIYEIVARIVKHNMQQKYKNKLFCINNTNFVILDIL